MSLVLHSYWRATAPNQVRIGLNLKGLAYDYVPVNLIKA
jgi:maleylacetoacetate isomerase/maleylpyruvate isomerase